MANPAESRMCGSLPARFLACRSPAVKAFGDGTQAGLLLSGACPDVNREARKRKEGVILCIMAVKESAIYYLSHYADRS